MSEIIEKLRSELIKKSSKAAQESSQRFFKEEISCYGLKVTDVTKIGKRYFEEISSGSKISILKYCEELWVSGNLEESFIACNWSYNIIKQLRREDFKVLEKWVNRYVNNWASCDTLCNHTIGDFVEMYPDFVHNLVKWTESENRWVKRASAVSLIIPARKGLFLEDIFSIADSLLSDTDDMVQKGYGWLLKAASQAHEKAVFDYIQKNKKVMPRTALRYAIEKMPENLRKEAMKK